ncbi:MAG: hypothetical protein ABS81_01190 [Pseudonocardia sp. SCN 72-86]|nr:MAG: hypothetical protein ABS81_01190 [Pseudonocardia sp. SCN 72-86]
MAIADYRGLREAGWTDDQLVAVLDEHDVTIDEVEVIFGFSAPPGPADVPERPGLTYADPDVEAAAFRMADVFGARRVQAVDRLGEMRADDEAIDAFGALCDRAAAHELGVALEFVPYSSISDLDSAVAVVEGAGRSNGGLCIDSWHFFRGGHSLDALAGVDPTRIVMIQINDGPMKPEDDNRMADAVHHRRCPGEGEFDLDGFVGTLARLGVEAPISVEIYSDVLDRLPSAVAARAAAASTCGLLDRARRPLPESPCDR